MRTSLFAWHAGTKRGGQVITRKDLIRLFANANAKGWSIPDDHFPTALEGDFFPMAENIFRAFEQISPNDVKYVILGQDPYPGCLGNHPFANGIAFDINDECLSDTKFRLNASLKVLAESLEITTSNPRETVLAFRKWISTKQVLMLNSSFTVEQGQPGTHQGIWENFALTALQEVRRKSPNAKFIALGRHAHHLISKALIPYAPHPAALSRKPEYRAEFDSFWLSGVGLELKQTQTTAVNGN